MSLQSSASSRSRIAPAPPSWPSGWDWWRARLFPPAAPPAGEPFAWLRFLHLPLALLGLPAIDPAAWSLYVTVVVVLTLAWPFCIRLAEDVEVYFPVTWTSAAAAYVVGLPTLPVFWVSATLGFALMFVPTARASCWPPGSPRTACDDGAVNRRDRERAWTAFSVTSST